MAQYEVEIKSLLGSSQKAEEVRTKLFDKNPRTQLISRQKQLNHYFVGDPKKNPETLLPVIPKEKQEEFLTLVKEGNSFSVRTRLIDNEDPIFVMKVSLDTGTSHNTVSRREFEIRVPKTTLDELDNTLLDAGFQYQAKWSREREEYKSGNIIICFDKNAGYGYLAEFEKVIEKEEEIAKTRKEIEDFMEQLGVKELQQDRLERMFAHYNQNWLDYYGTDKIFTIE